MNPFKKRGKNNNYNNNNNNNNKDEKEDLDQDKLPLTSDTNTTKRASTNKKKTKKKPSSEELLERVALSPKDPEWNQDEQEEKKPAKKPKKKLKKKTTTNKQSSSMDSDADEIMSTTTTDSSSGSVSGTKKPKSNQKKTKKVTNETSANNQKKKNKKSKRQSHLPKQSSKRGTILEDLESGYYGTSSSPFGIDTIEDFTSNNNTLESSSNHAREAGLMTLSHVEEYETCKSHHFHQHPSRCGFLRTKRNRLLLLTFAVFIIVVVIVGVLVGRSNNNKTQPDELHAATMISGPETVDWDVDGDNANDEQYMAFIQGEESKGSTTTTPPVVMDNTDANESSSTGPSLTSPLDLSSSCAPNCS